MFVTTKTPLRVSYLGGGTDYFDYCARNPGFVISTTIDKYVYVFANPLSKFAEENFRFTYRETESVKEASEIRHPVVREVLRQYGNRRRLNLGTFADIPGSSGLGGSSAFTVGLLRLMATIQNKSITAASLADEAIHLERNVLKEFGGFQDQMSAAFGGFRLYEFHPISRAASPSICDVQLKEYFAPRQILVWIGSFRASPITPPDENGSDPGILRDLAQITSSTWKEMADTNSVSKKFDILSAAMNQGWDLKKKSSKTIGSGSENIIVRGMRLGARSAKLCGAGGGGFVLFLADPEVVGKIETEFGSENTLRFELSETGTTEI